MFHYTETMACDCLNCILMKTDGVLSSPVRVVLSTCAQSSAWPHISRPFSWETRDAREHFCYVILHL